MVIGLSHIFLILIFGYWVFLVNGRGFVLLFGLLFSYWVFLMDGRGLVLFQCLLLSFRVLGGRDILLFYFSFTVLFLGLLLGFMRFLLFYGDVLVFL